MGRRVDVPLVIGFTWGCLSVDLRCVQWREGCRFGDFLVRCSVFCDYWFFYSVCLFVCLFFFSYQRLFNILLSWQHVPMPVIRFRIWRKFICIKSPWETHDSGPCLNGSSIINNLFMFCLWKISAVDKHVFWCHFQMYDDYLSCCCFWKIKDSWFLIPDSWRNMFGWGLGLLHCLSGSEITCKMWTWKSLNSMPRSWVRLKFKVK